MISRQFNSLLRAQK